MFGLSRPALEHAFEQAVTTTEAALICYHEVVDDDLDHAVAIQQAVRMRPNFDVLLELLRVFGGPNADLLLRDKVREVLTRRPEIADWTPL